jgi:starch synthase
VDYDEWNTTQNANLPKAFSAGDLSGKADDKVLLQRELGLPENPSIPLFGSIGRLADQKGVSLLLGAMREMLGEDLQFVLLGTGAPFFEHAFSELAQQHPSKAAVNIGFEEALSHRIEAACDFFLMPSRFEPCGLNQMYSLRYGTIPIVRQTGGLDDTIVDVREDAERADGIKFSENSVSALVKAMQKAIALFKEKDLLHHYRSNAMHADFSWQRTAKEYVSVYERILQGTPPAVAQ